MKTPITLPDRTLVGSPADTSQRRPLAARRQTARLFSPIPTAVLPKATPGEFQAHILVIDDDADVRHVLERVLCAAGYRVSGACDGLAGWNALCVGGFDLVITDHDMPRLKGVELIRLVRAVPFNVPIIMISGRMPSDEEGLQDLLWPGLSMEKPFSFTELLANVGRLLSQSTVAAAIHEGAERPEVEGAPVPPPVTAWQEAGRDPSAVYRFTHAFDPGQPLAAAAM